MKAKVKICGIKSYEDAVICVNAGADFLGFNFVGSSRHFINPKDAFKFVKLLTSKVKKVGIFQNESEDTVNKLIKLLDLDFVQLHGDESANYTTGIKGAGIIKVFPLEKDFDRGILLDQVKKYNTDYFLVDREKQGIGKSLSLERIRDLNIGKKLFLAGGLSDKNVRKAIEMTHSYAVDVAGGVETDGEKDKEKIYRFIREAKKYDF